MNNPFTRPSPFQPPNRFMESEVRPFAPPSLPSSLHQAKSTLPSYSHPYDSYEYRKANTDYERTSSYGYEKFDNYRHNQTDSYGYKKPNTSTNYELGLATGSLEAKNPFRRASLLPILSNSPPGRDTIGGYDYKINP